MSSRILTHIFPTNSDSNSNSIRYLFFFSHIPPASLRSSGQSGNTYPIFTPIYTLKIVELFLFLYLKYNEFETKILHIYVILFKVYIHLF